MSVKHKFKLPLEKFIVWIVVIMAILLLNRYAVNQATIRLPIFDNIRYGRYLFQKWFLVIIAFAVFAYFLKKDKKQINLKLLKQNILPIAAIGLVLVATRYLSFSHWFYHDDLGIISYHYYSSSLQGISCCAPGYYSLGMMFLVIRWFGQVFGAYKALGIFIHFLTGTAIYALASKIQKNKAVSFLSALFFVTTTTNFYQTISALEFMGDSFSLLLFILSIYTLLAGYWSGSVIFAAAAMEFGLSRTHFISLPLLLIMWFFVSKKKRWKPEWILTSLAFMVLPLTYLFVFPHITGPTGNPIAWNPIFVYASVLLGVTVPHTIIYPLIKYLRLLTGNFLYVAPFLGIAIFIGFTLMVVWSFYKKRSTTKLLFLGLVILLVSLMIPVLRGSRITFDPEGLTTQYLSNVPALSTGYGLFPAFGLVLMIIGLGQTMRIRIFKTLLIGIVIFNIFSYRKLDSNFADMYAVRERAINKQMEILLPPNNEPKVIYMPDRSMFYLGLKRFVETFRAKEMIVLATDSIMFMEGFNKYNPPKERIYYFALNENTNQVHDLSEKLRAFPSHKIEAGIETLSKDPDLRFFYLR